MGIFRCEVRPNTINKSSDSLGAHQSGSTHAMLGTSSLKPKALPALASFYDQNLKTLGKKVIIFSRSSMAPMTAFHMNIPFYSKALDTPMIKELVQDHPKEYLDWLPENYPKRKINELDSWETGSMEDLITQALTKPY